MLMSCLHYRSIVIHPEEPPVQICMTEVAFNIAYKISTGQIFQIKKREETVLEPVSRRDPQPYHIVLYFIILLCYLGVIVTGATCGAGNSHSFRNT